jgi:hypothetical protein
MGVLVKVISALLVIGGIYIWVTGRSVMHSLDTPVNTSALSASVILAPRAESGVFDEVGTIIIDTSHGEPGNPFLLYTKNNDTGKPSVRTKRLIFLNQDACAAKDLPCASGQPDAPVLVEEQVRIVGSVKDDTVEVSELYRVSP